MNLLVDHWFFVFSIIIFHFYFLSFSPLKVGYNINVIITFGCLSSSDLYVCFIYMLIYLLLFPKSMYVYLHASRVACFVKWLILLLNIIFFDLFIFYFNFHLFFQSCLFQFYLNINVKGYIILSFYLFYK